MICCVVAARPNFIKMAPVILEARRRGLKQICVHTGQHYDARMSAVFFEELGMPMPDVDLGVGSGSHAMQTAAILAAFEAVCLEQKPDLLIVGGDVNSTLACGLVAAKLLIPVAHVEAGLRSYDRTMPEEINRILTDHMATLLFTTEPSGTRNLIREGIPMEKIHFVGNSMIDSLRLHLDKALAIQPWKKFRVKPGQYGMVTLHRPTNVDDPTGLSKIVSVLEEIATEIPLLFPVHPRTRARLESGIVGRTSLQLIEPLGYLDFIGLMARSRVVLTDSGGIQEETTALRVPCITMRENTERPITIEAGTNRLAGIKREAILAAVDHALSAKSSRNGSIPELWDGRASSRIVDVIQRYYH
jgi:UDP-N-acetylglucosamine 2-epimerase (non-hydrolysing)